MLYKLKILKKKKLNSLSLEEFFKSKPHLKVTQKNFSTERKMNNRLGNEAEKRYAKNEGYYYYDGNNWIRLKDKIFKKNL